MVLGSRPPSAEPKTPKPRKVSKSLPKGVWDPPTPDPPKVPKKVPKKVRKVRKIVKINYFFDFSDLFRNFLGVRGRGGPKLLSGDSFGTFRGFGVLGSVDGRRDPKHGQHNFAGFRCLLLGPEKANEQEETHKQNVYGIVRFPEISWQLCLLVSFFSPRKWKHINNYDHPEKLLMLFDSFFVSHLFCCLGCVPSSMSC